MRHIPNFITSLNLAAGFFSIVFAFNGSIITSSWLILAAMVFDFLDGFSARLLGSYSVIGKELDSLADIVSFGVAPAILIYQMLGSSPALNDTIPENIPVIKAAPMLILTVIMPICAALRLAKFNTDETQSKSFKGLPTPANALAVISVIIAGHYTGSDLINSFTGSVTALSIFTVILSLLMVTRIPMLSLKLAHFRIKGNEGRYLLALLVASSFLVFGIGAAPLIIPLYIIASVISLFFK